MIMSCWFAEGPFSNEVTTFVNLQSASLVDSSNAYQLPSRFENNFSAAFANL